MNDDISVISSDYAAAPASSVPMDDLALLSRVPGYSERPAGPEGPSGPPASPVSPVTPRYYPAEPMRGGAPRLDTPDEDALRERSDLLFTVRKMQAQGHIMDDVSPDAPIKTLKEAVDRVTTDLAAKRSVEFQRKLLITFISGIEMLNSKFDPFGANLDGWSEAVHSDLASYDEIFEQLFLKYRGRSQMSPEASLLLTLTGSAVMFHVQKEMFKPLQQAPRAAAPRQSVAKAPPVMMPKSQSARARSAAGAPGAAPGGIRGVGNVEEYMKKLESEALKSDAMSVLSSGSSDSSESRDSSSDSSSDSSRRPSIVSKATTNTRKRRMMQLEI